MPFRVIVSGGAHVDENLHHGGIGALHLRFDGLRHPVGFGDGHVRRHVDVQLGGEVAPVAAAPDCVAVDDAAH